MYNMLMKKFKHSGTSGDLIYGLALMKHFGGGEFYLHLNQVDWTTRHYYGGESDAFHRGRMNQADAEFMRDFLLAQDYITSFGTLDNSTEITHNLDRFRTLFVGHPTNYLDIYSRVFNLTPDQQALVNSTPWLTVPTPTVMPGKSVVISRTQRWIPAQPGSIWQDIRDEAEPHAVFVGLPEEHVAFKQQVGWDIPHVVTHTLLELAQVIAGAETFVGNQSQALALAVGLGVSDIICESRVDLPLERNECYFPRMPNVRYT